MPAVEKGSPLGKDIRGRSPPPLTTMMKDHHGACAPAYTRTQYTRDLNRSSYSPSLIELFAQPRGRSRWQPSAPSPLTLFEWADDRSMPSSEVSSPAEAEPIDQDGKHAVAS